MHFSYSVETTYRRKFVCSYFIKYRKRWDTSAAGSNVNLNIQVVYEYNETPYILVNFWKLIDKLGTMQFLVYYD